MAPREFAGWREHLRRYPLDRVERLLCVLIARVTGENIPDYQLRPGAYGRGQLAAILKNAERARKEKEDRDFYWSTPAGRRRLGTY